MIIDDVTSSGVEALTIWFGHAARGRLGSSSSAAAVSPTIRYKATGWLSVDARCAVTRFLTNDIE